MRLIARESDEPLQAAIDKPIDGLSPGMEVPIAERFREGPRGATWAGVAFAEEDVSAFACYSHAVDPEGDLVQLPRRTT